MDISNCSKCGLELSLKEVGDEDLVSYCASCEKTFSNNMPNYNKTQDFWDDIFKNYEDMPLGKKTGHKDLDEGIQWLSLESTTILDYGCGVGTMLFQTLLYGDVHKLIGIDISTKAIGFTKKIAEKNHLSSKTEFLCDGIEALKNIPDSSVD